MNKPEVIIYSLGQQWETRKKLLNRAFKIIAYSDKKVTDIENYTSPENLYNIHYDYVYITSVKYFDEIKKNLIEKYGIKEESIIGEKELHLFVGNLSFGIIKIKERVARQINTLINSMGKKLLGAWYDIFKELHFIRKSKNKEENIIVVIGANKYGKYFAERISKYVDSYWGITTVSQVDVLQSISPRVRDINELIYEDIDKLKVYIIDPYRVIKTMGVLLDMGIKEDSIKTLGEASSRGSRFQDVFDINLGYTWIDDGIPGFVLFKGGPETEKRFRIVTLGGSTSDPTLVNIKSWSEILFDKIIKVNGNVEIYAGGLGAYTSTQELQKLIRDVMVLKPDLVISYSGINDASEMYYEPGHPFVLSYQADMFRKYMNGNSVKNVLQGDRNISEYTLGLEDNCDISEHWLYCERMMHTICQEYGITFYGVLQAYNRNAKNVTEDKKCRIESFYNNVKEKIRDIGNPEWLKDFTDIFDGEKNIYFDLCHVYEKGNRIIASHMIPYVLQAMKGGQRL